MFQRCTQDALNLKCANMADDRLSLEAQQGAFGVAAAVTLITRATMEQIFALIHTALGMQHCCELAKYPHTKAVKPATAQDVRGRRLGLDTLTNTDVRTSAGAKTIKNTMILQNMMTYIFFRYSYGCTPSFEMVSDGYAVRVMQPEQICIIGIFVSCL